MADNVNTMTEAQQKDLVRQRIIRAFEKDADSLARVLFYLTEEERTYAQIPTDPMEVRPEPPVWKTLKALVTWGTPESFLSYAERLAQDTKRADTDVLFRDTMARIYGYFLPPSDNQGSPEQAPDYILLAPKVTDASILSGFSGLAQAWDQIPLKTQEMIVKLMQGLANKHPLFTAADEVVGLLSEYGGNLVLILITAGQITYDFSRSIYLWQTGQISAKRCCHNIVGSLTQVGCGVAGGYVGSIIGTAIAPGLGTLVGGIAGGYSAAKFAQFLFDFLSRKVFDLPKEAALENAYNFFGLSMHPTANEVNTAYRRKCLEHHPDKGGRREEFDLIKTHLAIIHVHWKEQVQRGNITNANINNNSPEPPLAITSSANVAGLID